MMMLETYKELVIMYELGLRGFGAVYKTCPV